MKHTHMLTGIASSGRTCTLMFMLALGSYGFAQEKEKYPYSKWDAKTIKKAETYTDEDNIPGLEREIIYLTNLCRLNPKLFAQTYVKQYLDENNLKTANTASLVKDLNKCHKLEALTYSEDLYYCAKAHAESNGKKGLEGHQHYNTRFKKYASQYTTHGENCDYGNNSAIDVVMSLLIDEDVPGTGHRKNILDKQFKAIGVAYAAHKKLDHNVVMCFGGL
ncbi:MAG TPA: CAP domain-containing protein [Flavobacteriales bacterium]|nr:CAP domain-containing protein [Flavobacteriales bacterium]